MTAPRVLVIGAGAVGQVFGRHLARAGAALTFFVREKYADEVRRGFDMYPLAMTRGRRAHLSPVRFEGFDVITSLEEIAARRFDQVYITLPSNAVRGAFMTELAAALGTDPDGATLVSLQPMADDREAILAAGVPESRLVSGMISFIAYAAPLEGEARFPRPGMAYWFPPLSPSPFSGPDARTRAVVALLTRGGLPARRHRDVPRAVGFPSVIGMAYLTALEAVDWSLRALRASSELALAARAGREAIAIVARTWGPPAPIARLGMALAVRPVLVTLALWFAERVMPLPLEAYLRTHFTKVGEQTRLIVSSVIADGRAASLPVRELEALAATVPS